MPRLVSHGLLLLTSFIWGITFVFQTTGMDELGPYGFTAFRFLAGTIAVLPMALWERKRTSTLSIIQSAKDDQSALVWGVLFLGVLMFIGSVLQQVSLGITSVANTAFLTTLYVPLVPLLGLVLFKRNIRGLRWMAVGIFIIGSWLMSGASPREAVLGDMMVVIGAVFWAAHIMLVGWMAQRTNTPFQLAFVQTLITMVLSFVVFIAFEMTTFSATWHGVMSAWPEILFAGVMSTGLGFTLQLIAQQHCSNAAAAIILSLEGVFAAVAGWIILGQSMMVSAMIGAGFIFIAVLIVECTPEKPVAKNL